MKTLKKILFILVLAIFIPLLAMNITIMIKSIAKPNEVPSVFGYKPMIVLTGSMEDEIMPGDLVLSKAYNNESLKVGDIITFRDTASTVITHRILRTDYINNEKVYVTKGDNNNVADDGYITQSSIEGIYKARIPHLGSALNFIQTPTGIIILILSILIIGLLIIAFGNHQTEEEEELLKEFEEFKKNKESTN